jgi:hypothetical protein
MKQFNKRSVLTGSVLSVVMSLVLGLAGPLTAFAATTPSLGEAASYAILGSTYTNTSAGTTVSGDIGFTTGPAVAPGGTHTNYGSAAPYATAGVDQGTALAALAAQSCTFTFAAGAINLSTDTTHGAIGVYAPGVYCSTGAMDVGGPLTLNGSGTYIFRPVGALTTTAGAVVTLNGASACDVFWTPSAATTLAANTTFAGTLIGDAGVTVGANTTWTGRALAFGGTVTTDTDTISAPSCSAPVVPAAQATLHVIKTVVNDDGGVAVASSAVIHVKSGSSDVSGSPQAGAGSPGTSYTLDAGTYTVSEDSFAGYNATFSGDCNSSGSVTLVAGGSKTCTITNNDIAAVVATSTTGTITVIKTVVNDDGGTMVASDFPLFVSGTSVSSGVATSFVAGSYTVTETEDSSYTGTFSGDCDANGTITLAADEALTCTLTNDDVAAEVLVSPVVATVTSAVVPEVTSTVVPGLPDTGANPSGNLLSWRVVATGFFASALFLLIRMKKVA